MSSTTILAVYPGERTEDLEELRNSHGFAPYVWSALCRRYLDDEHAWLFGRDQPLWDLAHNPGLPAHHRTVLAITFDNAYILAEDFSRAAERIREFLAEFPPPPDHSNHWCRIAELLESAPDVPAIGFWGTSVSERPFAGEFNEDVDDYEPPDWSICRSVYAILDGQVV